MRRREKRTDAGRTEEALLLTSLAPYRQTTPAHLFKKKIFLTELHTLRLYVGSIIAGGGSHLEFDVEAWTARSSLWLSSTGMEEQVVSEGGWGGVGSNFNTV